MTSGRHDGGSPVGGRAFGRHGERPVDDPGRELDALLTNWGSEPGGRHAGTSGPPLPPPSRPQRPVTRADGWSSGGAGGRADHRGDDRHEGFGGAHHGPRGSSEYGHPAAHDLGEPARGASRPAQGLHSALLGNTARAGPPPAGYPPPIPPPVSPPGRPGVGGRGGGRSGQWGDPDPAGYGDGPGHTDRNGHGRNGHAAGYRSGAADRPSYADHNGYPPGYPGDGHPAGSGGAGWRGYAEPGGPAGHGGYPAGGYPDGGGYGDGDGYIGGAAYAGGLDVEDRDPGLLTHRAAYDPDGDPLGDRYGYPPPPAGGGYDPDDASFYPDDDFPPDDPRGRDAGRHRRPGRPGWVKVMAWVFAVVGLFGAAVGGWGFFEYHRLSNNITRIDALAPNDPAIKQAAKQRNAENFLLIGSDTREGANSKFGDVSGARSDTTILAHLSPNRDKALLISFPRDSYVDLPSCQKTGGGASAESQGLFNSAFEIGGPKCTVLAVQKLTGIAVNHYVQVDFTGFQTMVEALGGVTICSTEDVYDKNSGLRLHKGNQVLRGAQALAFVRARKALGDGSDIGRIQRQQRFLGAMVRKATSSRLLFNPLALTRFLDAATKSLTLDRATSLKDLKALSDQLRDLDPKKVSFLTAPIANQDYSPPGTAYRGKVLLDDVAGRRLWDSIINDKPAPPKGAPTQAKPKTTAKITLSVAPGDVSVKVLNGVGVNGLAARTAADLTSVGFAVSNTGNGPLGTKASQIRYAPARLAAAQTLAAAVPGAVLQEDNSLGHTVQFVVGTNYHGATAVQVGQQVAAPPTSATTTTPTSTTNQPPPTPVPTITAGDTSCA